MKTQTKNKQTAGSNMKYKEKKNASWEIVTKGKKELSSESPRGQHREGHLLCPCPTIVTFYSLHNVLRLSK